MSAPRQGPAAAGRSMPTLDVEALRGMLERREPVTILHAIVGVNEAGELPAGDPTDLEAGANRCAVS